MNAKLDTSSLLPLLKETYQEWSADRALRLSAALAYYAIFSIAPLLVIAIALAGWFLGPAAAQGHIKEALHGTLGPAASQAVETMIQSASRPASSIIATILGLLTLLVGASGVFAQLKDALNTVWEVQRKPGLGWRAFVSEHLLSFGMVLAVGFLLLVSLILSTILSGFYGYFSTHFALPAFLWPILGTLVSFAILTALFALLFKFLPDAHIPWNQVWIGAAVTAILFEIGKWLLALYLGRASTASPYGAAASVILLLLWIYYASAILLFGAEFTRVYARRAGATVRPKSLAERVTLHQRIQQGLAPAKAEEPRPTGPAIVPVPIYSAPTAPPLPHHLNEVPEFFRESAAASLLTALGCGLLVGTLTRRHRAPETPRVAVEEIGHGSRTLAKLVAALAATASRRIAEIARHSMHDVSHWKPS